MRRHLRAYWTILLVVVPLGLLEVGIDGGLTLSYKFLIDLAIVPHNSRALVTILAVLAAAIILASLTSFWRDHYFARMSSRVLADIRTLMFEHCQRLPVGYFAGHSSSSILSLFSTGVAVIEASIAGALNTLLLPALSVLMGVGILFVLLDWQMALIGALVWPLVLIAPRFVTPRATAAAHTKKEHETALLNTVEETLGAHRVVKAFGLEPFVQTRFQRALTPLSSEFAKSAFLSSLVERSTVISIYVVQFIALGTGAYLSYRGKLTVGSFIAFLTVFWSLGWSIVVLARSAPILISALVSMRQIDALLAESGDTLDDKGTDAMPPLATGMALRDVEFAYPGQPRVLHGVSLNIKQNDFVALVGPSGSGKSTVLNLLSRLYDADRGAVLVDGRDMNDYTTRSIRAHMGFVFQESVLFDMSVRENIRLGRPDATDDQVVAAAKAADVHDTITALPLQYDSMVGDRGALLSGGQRQRVAIARALLRNPGILLLDEATSALDPASEAAINATLMSAGRGRTTIAVTHRLGSVTHADQIFVMKAGRVAESGTHESLLAQDGVYAELWRKQSGLTVSGDGSSAAVSAERLREIPMLNLLADSQLESLAAKFASERVSAGQHVIRQGDQGSLFYIVARGSLAVVRTGGSGVGVEVARLEQGDEFGELALLYDEPRNATITALSDSLLLTLTRENFATLLLDMPEVRTAIEAIAGVRRTYNETEVGS